MELDGLVDKLRRGYPGTATSVGESGWLVLHVSLHGAQRPATYRIEFDAEPDGAQVMEMLASAEADGLVLFGQKWDYSQVRWSQEAYVWIPAHNIRQVVASFQTDMENLNSAVEGLGHAQQ